MQIQWVFLAVAIVGEVIGTSALKASEGFTRLWPSVIVVAGYASAFYFLSLTLKTISVGVAYAIWSGAGIALISLVAWFLHGQSLDLPAITGLSSSSLASLCSISLPTPSLTHEVPNLSFHEPAQDNTHTTPHCPISLRSQPESGMNAS